MIRVFVIDPRQSNSSSAFVDALLNGVNGDASKSETHSPSLSGADDGANAQTSDQAAQTHDGAAQPAIQ